MLLSHKKGGEGAITPISILFNMFKYNDKNQTGV